MPDKRPPFRADHVGSLLRPPELLAARERFRAGAIDLEAVTAAEDEAIRGVVAFQESIGLKVVTDGEFRRASFHTDFLRQLEGMTSVPSEDLTHFRSAVTGESMARAPPKLVVSGRLRRSHPIMGPGFEVLKAAAASATPKVTIPSPSMAHFRGGRAAVDAGAYPEMEAFFADLGRVWREEIADLAARGLRYLQLDDTNLAYLCDQAMREAARGRGEDPDALPALYARLINDAISGAPRDMVTAIHLCRGNFRSAFVASGGYEPVAEAMFNQTRVDAFFLEYDDARSGDFAPLRFVPKGRFVVLGLISSKLAALESRDDVLRRIDEAARVLPLEQLCLSPQCGFASTEAGNELTFDDQRRKLELVVRIAREVWGDG
jgi:5-methyltetrahydropteroyltriglutamate--homocysteine methyltransferase